MKKKFFLATMVLLVAFLFSNTDVGASSYTWLGKIAYDTPFIDGNHHLCKNSGNDDLPLIITEAYLASGELIYDSDLDLDVVANRDMLRLIRSVDERYVLPNTISTFVTYDCQRIEDFFNGQTHGSVYYTKLSTSSFIQHKYRITWWDENWNVYKGTTYYNVYEEVNNDGPIQPW